MSDEYISEISNESIERCDRLFEEGMVFYNNKEFDKAINVWEECYELRKEVLGERNRQTLNVLYNLGIVYDDNEEYENAIQINKLCYELRKDVLGEKNLDTLDTLNNLGVSYHNNKEYDKAIYTYKVCYELRKEVQGDKNSDTLNTLYNLGEIYGEIGNYDKTISVYGKCCDLRKEILEERSQKNSDKLNYLQNIYEHKFSGIIDIKREIEMLNRLYNLEVDWNKNRVYKVVSYICDKLFEFGVNYYNDMEYVKAIQTLKTCYEFGNDMLEVNSPNIINSLYNLGICYRYEKNYEKAIQTNKKCYELREELFGKRDINTLKSLNNLGVSYDDKGEYEKSISVFKGCYELRKEVLGEEAPDTLRSLNNLGISYNNNKEYEKAINIHEKCYELRKEVLGEDNLDTLNSLYNLGISYLEKKEYEKSISVFKRCYELRKEVLGEEAPDTLRSLNNLGNSYGYAKKYEKAINIHKKCYNLRKEVLGKRKLDTLRSLNNLGCSYGAIGEYKMAINIHEKCYKLMKVILGEKEPDTLGILYNLGTGYRLNKEYEKAINSYETYKRFLENKDSNYVNILKKLADLYYKKGNYFKGIKYIEEAYECFDLINKDDIKEKIDILSIYVDFLRSIYCYDAAIEKQKECYKLVVKKYGEDSEMLYYHLSKLALCYNDDKNERYASNIYKNCFTWYCSLKGYKDENTLAIMHSYQKSLNNIEQYNKAIRIGEKCYSYMLDIFKEDNDKTVEVLRTLVYSYFNLGDFEKAIQYAKTNNAYNFLHYDYSRWDSLYALHTLAMCYNGYIGNKEEEYKEKARECERICYEQSCKTLGKYDEFTLEAKLTLIKYFSLMIVSYNEVKTLLEEYFSDFKNIISKKWFFYKVGKMSLKKQIISFTGYYQELLNNILKYKSIKVYWNIALKYKNYIYDLEFYTRKFDYNQIEGTMQEIFLKEKKFKEEKDEIEKNKLKNEIDNLYVLVNQYSSIVQYNNIIDNTTYENVQKKLVENESAIDIYYIKNKKTYICFYLDKVNLFFVKGQDIKECINQIRNKIWIKDIVYICPDGDLYNTSFEEMLEGHNVGYLLTLKSLLDYKEEESSNNNVLFTYPDFSLDMKGDEEVSEERDYRVKRLLGSLLEEKYFHDYIDDCKIYQRKEANYSHFLEIKNPKILHVSTHADYLDKNTDNPMKKGVLCLAGYNVKPGDEIYGEGCITADEIQFMDLKGTELVVLSACKTAKGESIEGEGVYGLRRAFELAGAKTMLITLDSVDDINTALFMKIFYRKYFKLNNVYTAYKETKSYLREYGIDELECLLTDIDEIGNRFENPLYRMILKDTVKERINESKSLGFLVKKRRVGYIKEDWSAYIVQGIIR